MNNTNYTDSYTATILVVDDRRGTRAMLRKVMEQDGYTVIEAKNGEEALESFITNKPEVILMDIQMPQMDGLTACSKLKKLPEGDRAHVLMFTGLEDQELVEKAFKLGASDFISKPINHEELRYRVKRLLYLRSIEKTIQKQAFYDSLTNLPNRLLFNDRLSTALAHAENNNHSLAVLYLNLRNFKLINNAFGYDQGDIILQEAAERLTSTLQKGFTVSRYSGDQFAIFTPPVSTSEDTVKIALNILDTLQRPYQINNQEINISCTIGIALFPHEGQDSQTLIQNAETAMLRAGDTGSNSYRFFDQKMNVQALEKITLQNDLINALKNNELLLYYQPQVAANNKVAGYEALIRWEHPNKGIIPPDAFIPLAEETGLIVPIGKWVLQTACEWHSHDLARLLNFSINVSVIQLQNSNFVEMVEEILHETKCSPQHLKLEITENIIIQDINYTIKILNELKALGVKISVDDFGTGYSSLYYLKKLPIDEVKIDRSFIRDIPGNPETASVVEMMILLGEKLNLPIVAEGVETEEQLSFLRALKEDIIIQGYYFSKPLPAEKLIDFFAESK